LRNVEVELALPFEFIIDGPAVSQQARRESVRKWREEVRTVAERFWPTGDLPVTEPVMLTISYFYLGGGMDVDNIAKPIADALKELVYVDDDQLTDLACRKRDLNGNLRLLNPSPILAEGFERGRQFLHVVVDSAPDLELIA
jgi:Holliday junction resolvase RusA-like endonuclease